MIKSAKKPSSALSSDKAHDHEPQLGRAPALKPRAGALKRRDTVMSDSGETWDEVRAHAVAVAGKIAAAFRTRASAADLVPPRGRLPHYCGSRVS